MFGRVAPKRFACTGPYISLDSWPAAKSIFSCVGVALNGELGARYLLSEGLRRSRPHNRSVLLPCISLADTVNPCGHSISPTGNSARARTSSLLPDSWLLLTGGPTQALAPAPQPTAPSYLRPQHLHHTLHPYPTRGRPVSGLRVAEHPSWAHTALRFLWPGYGIGAPSPPPAASQRRWFSSPPSKFQSLGVSSELQERLAALGLTAPLPVQAAAVPLILSGRNTAVKSCTGSGKTLAYLLPIVQLALERRRAALAAATAAAGGGSRHDANQPAASSSDGGKSRSSTGRQYALAALKRQSKAPQAVIVAPSRELCIQIQCFAQDLMPEPSANRRLVAQLVGGANPKRQVAALSGGDGGAWPLVVVGTPGRVADMLTQGSLHVWGCPLLVLDEVDQLYGQSELRQHVDTIAAHVGRHWQPHPARVADHPLTGQLDSQPPGPHATRTAPADASTSAADALSNISAASGHSGGSGGRQTVIVSASLDARDPGRYAAWCPDPAFVVLASLQALPPPVLKTLHPAPEALGLTPGERRGTAQGGPIGAPPGEQVSADQFQRQAGGPHTPSQWPLGPMPNNEPGSDADAATANGDLGANAVASGPLSGVLPPHLAHLYVLSHSRHRTDRVRRLIHALQAERVLLFVPKQNQTMVTKYRLEARRMEVTILHGRLTKMERRNILNAFRRGVFRVLVVTDLGARGLDLPDCDAVINFGAPADALAYAHRAGRTGRAGAPGVVVTVVTRLELPGLQRIARQLGVNLQAASVSYGSIAPGEEATGADPSESE